MKTKNIFRMLLIAVVLLVGANNAGALTLTYKYTLSWQNETVYQTYELNEGDAFIIPEDGPSVEGYTFPGWGDNLPQTMPNYDYYVSANLIPIDYDITLNVGEHGTVTTNKNNNIGHIGDEVELYINPVWSYEIDQLTVTAADGTDIPVSSNKFIMPAQNVTVNATFKTNTTPKYDVWKLDNIQNGSVSANPNYQVEEGTTITLSSNPNAGYELDYYSISTDGTNYNAIEGNTFSMPGSNVWVSATFKQLDTPTKTDVTLSFPQAAYTATMGESFTAPELTKSADVNVTYSSNNTGVATVDQSTGAITLVAAGQATITATFAGNDAYNEATANYTLTVNAAAQEPVEVTDGETTIWEDAVTTNYWKIDASEFANTASTTKICVYVDNSDGIYLVAADNSWSKLWAGGTGDGGEYHGTTYYNSSYKCYEFELGEFLSIIQANGVYIQSKGSTISKVTLLNGEHTGTATPTKTDVTLSFPQAAYTATMGESFTAPELTKSADVNVTYSSNNTGVATVDQSTGAITLVAAGQATITATFAGNDAYNEATVSYTLTVNAAEEEQGTVYGSSSGNVWTFDFASVASGFDDKTKIVVSSAVATSGSKSLGTGSWAGGNSFNSKLLFDTNANEETWQLRTSALYLNNSNRWLGFQDCTKGDIITVTFDSEPANAPSEGANVTATSNTSTVYVYKVNDNGDAFISFGNKNYISSITIEPAPAAQTDFTFTINNVGEGTINLYRDTAKEGDVVTINASPNQYYYELGEVTVVDESGNEITVENNQFTMPASNVTITATFVLKKYTLTWQITGEEEAYLEQQVEYGATIVEPETAPSKDGFVFNGWGQHEATMPAYNYTVTGSFSQVYNITLNYDNTKGSAELSKNTSLGNQEVIYVTVTPAEGYEVASVTAIDDNGAVYVSGNYQFPVGSSDVTVTVTFKEAAAITYSVNNNYNSQYGSVAADVTEAEAGATVTLSNHPSQGYELDYYVVTAGDEEIEVTNGQFTMPESDVTISGVFKLGTYTITYYVDGAEWETQTYTYGDAIVLPSEPSKDGYTFNSWQGLNYQTMPGWNLQVYAYFIQNGSGNQGTEDDTEYVNVTVGSTGYATFCSNKALDVTGLSVYYAVSIDDENVTLRKLTGVVAAGTGLLVKGNTSIPVSSEGGTTYNDNLLVGVLTTTEAPSGAYVLISKDGEATFAQTYDESKATVPAGKAYLMAPSGARYLSIKFDDNATGISTMKMELTDDDVIYNLRGQRVSNPRSGLYIVNGKKVFIK